MNRSTPTRTSSIDPSRAILIALLLLAVLTAAPAGAGNRKPDLGDCDELAVPADQEIALHVYAAGVQIYRWNGANWAFVGPEAILYADEDDHGVVGIHYAGPTWESNSGSKVVAAVVHPCPVDPSSIAWLKLAAVSSNGPGIFNGVTFIQRLNTVGGLAPTEDGDFVGEEARIPYTAEYYFYRAKH